LKIYPNPANRNIWIESKNQVIHRIELFNSTGYSMENFFQQMKTNESIELVFQSIPVGIYFLKITTTEKIITQKITISE
jgi:hypothetical protein